MMRFAWIPVFAIVSISMFLAAAPVAGFETNDPVIAIDHSLLVPKARAWPKLTLNNDPTACAGYLEAMRASFESMDHQVTLRGGLAAWQGARSLFDIEPYEEDRPRGARPFVLRVPEDHRDLHHAMLKVDLNRDGDAEGLLFSWSEFGWRGYAYNTRLVPASVLAAVESALSAEAPLPDSLIPGLIDLTPHGRILLHPTFVETEQGGIYHGTPFALDRPHKRELKRVTASGSEVVCRVAIYPRLRFDADTHDLFENIQRSLGEDRCGGTLRALDRTKTTAAIARGNFAVRPWALSVPIDDWTVLWDSLEHWSFLDPWSRQVYLNIAEAYPRALDERMVRLVEDFGVPIDSPDLRSLAETLLWRAIGAHYVFGGSGSSSLYAASDSVVAQLYRDVDTAAKLDALFSDPEIDRTRPDYLFALVDRPGLLEHLVALGAKVDASNSYGKTALMYAAQLDHADTVARLIGLGANVNRRTHMASYGLFCLEPQITRRTALTYAAENASFETIRTLLDAGADPRAKRGALTVSDLLDGNARLSDERRSELAHRLLPD